jgi:hypothetical protein
MEKLFVKKINCCDKCPAYWIQYHAIPEEDTKGCSLYKADLKTIDTGKQIHPDCQLLDADKVLEIKMKD